MRISYGLKVFQSITFSRYLAMLTATSIVAVFLFASDYYNSSALNSLRLYALDGLSPALAMIQSASKEVQNGANKVSDFLTAYKQLDNLRQENENLKHWKAIALSLISENKALRHQINVVPESFRPVVTARVLSYPSHLGVHRIIIQAGTDHGVQENQPVVTANGVIGRVIHAGKKASNVLLVTDRYSRIPITIEPIQQHAILSGTQNDYLLIDHLEKEVALEPGMHVFTSGKGGVFPAGLYLGSTSKNGDKIIIEPVVDWRNLDFVQILTQPDLSIDDNEAQHVE